MTDYIKMKVDGGDEITISWEEDEEGLVFNDFMEKVGNAIVAAGYSREMVNQYMETE
jgi:hypothetical protein